MKRLILTLPATLLACTIAVNATEDTRIVRQLDDLLNAQQECNRNHNDIFDALLFTGSKLCGPKEGFAGGVNKRVAKVAAKQIIERHLVPEELRSISISLLGTDVIILDEDQAAELAYRLGECLTHGDPRDAVMRALGFVYVREKLVQLANWLLKGMCGECPVSEHSKKMWALREAWMECLRALVDDQVMNRAIRP